MEKEKFVIISSLAIDHITDTKGVLRKRKGGPALWICRVLKKFNIPFTLIKGSRSAVVDIRLTNDGEHGKARKVYPISIHTPRTAKVFILSTIGNEFPIEQWKLLRGTLVVDFQGYIRDAHMTGTRINIPNSVTQHIGIVKVTTPELLYLPSTFVTSQKRRILIITHGAAGFEVFCRGKWYEFASKGSVLSDAIGAGDTLLTAFAIEWFKSKNISKSALAAQDTVEHLLKNRKKRKQKPPY